MDGGPIEQGVSSPATAGGFGAEAEIESHHGVLAPNANGQDGEGIGETGHVAEAGHSITLTLLVWIEWFKRTIAIVCRALSLRSLLIKQPPQQLPPPFDVTARVEHSIKRQDLIGQWC